MLHTLDRALWMLTFFRPNHPEWGVTELARELGLPKSVVQKTLATFARRGFLHQDSETRRYRLGLRFLGLSQSVVRDQEVARIAGPHLAELAQQTGETAKLSVEDEGESVILAVVESTHPMRMTGRVGERYPLYAGASNKLLAAHIPWERLWPTIERQAGPSHIVRRDPDAFRQQLSEIASQGYAVSTGENEPEVTAVSAPVRGATGDVLASLSVLGPASRFPREQRDRIVSNLLRTATAISREIGWGESGEGRDALS